LHLVEACSWNGLKNDLKEHVKAAHPEYFFEVPSLCIAQLSQSLAIASCFGQLFTYYQQIRDGRFYGAVQLIGTSSESVKYKYKSTLPATNGIEKICKTLFVRGYSEDWETIFNSGICLCLDEKTVKHFLVENELELTIKLSRV
jgi:hypothetical protein